jgi:TolA-binding protein
MTKVLLCIAALAAFGSPSAAVAQGAGQAAHVDARLGELQRALSALSAQLVQLKAQNQELEQRLEKMQTGIGQRLERLEKKPAAKPAPARSGASR